MGIVCSPLPPFLANISDPDPTAHDWERIIVVWRRDSGFWTRKQLLLSTHDGCLLPIPNVNSQVAKVV